MQDHDTPATARPHAGESAARHPRSETAVDLAYEVSGAPGKPVLLLVHGGTASRRAWDLVTPALRAAFRVVAVDLRGHGQSPAPADGYSALQLSADVSRIVDALALTEVTLVGHSLGGMTAACLAAHRSDVVRRLVLVNTPVAPGAVEALASVMQRVHRPDFFPLTPAFIEEWASHPRPVPASFLADQRAHLAALPQAVWQQTFDELAKADIGAVLAHIAQPTLILWGARDRLLDTAQRDRLHAAIANARLVVIDDAGHNPSSATPERVVAEIRSFAG